MRQLQLSILALLGLGACSYDEGLEILDLKGKVILPEEAAQRDIFGTVTTDVRLIGPVYLGLYSDIQSQTREYPYPAVGPTIAAGETPDTFPYGGTTVGDVRYACIKDLTCKLSSGRFEDFDAIVDWFALVGDPLTDSSGDIIDSGEYIRQICMEQLHFTSDDEIRLTGDLDFTQRNDGKWEADFTVWQQEWYEGFSIWGWMDSPAASDFTFSTCDPEDGYDYNDYNEEFQGGRQHRELLNHPSLFIGEGDWVPGADPDPESGKSPYVWEDPTEIKEIDLSQMVEF